MAATRAGTPIREDLERALAEMEAKIQGAVARYEARTGQLWEILTAPTVAVVEQECVRCRQERGLPHLTSTCRDQARILQLRELIDSWSDTDE